ncbi:MAG: prepilin-type N-terminal cleavage/methylation domain-containing protein [Planctomycetes bacterium]|nr:prepilin-type N-terminal cleavage/methylation domain-containing protein [Planctomycetota bacterium]
MSDLTYPKSGLRKNDGYDLRGLSGGFTLVELLIVIAIISIAALTAIPMMSSAASVQIRSASNMLAADLEYAKSMAISRAQYYSVVFDVSTDSYWIEDQDDNPLPHPVKKGFNYVIDFQNDGRLKKVDIINVDFDTTSKVTFDYLGSPYNGNSTPLNNGIISLQAGGATTTVMVEPVTGYISIQ